MKISVVIPSHNDPAGLYFTAAATYADLEQDYPGQFEIIGVVDTPGEDFREQYENCRPTFNELVWGQFGAPQRARQAGFQKASGNAIFFLDSHVIPSRGMFYRMLETLREKDAAIVHAPHVYWERGKVCYAYHFDYGKRFWVMANHSEPCHPEPYRVGVMGHGAIVVDRARYESVGGYCLKQRGWGGEEPELNLKFWMLGHTCWVDPRAYHWHYNGRRRTGDVYKSPEFIRNFMIAAYEIGGRKYLDNVYGTFAIAAYPHRTMAEAIDAARNPQPDPFYSDYKEIPALMESERARICAGPWGGDLEKLRAYFDSEGVIH